MAKIKRLDKDGTVSEYTFDGWNVKMSSGGRFRITHPVELSVQLDEKDYDAIAAIVEKALSQDGRITDSSVKKYADLQDTKKNV